MEVGRLNNKPPHSIFFHLLDGGYKIKISPLSIYSAVIFLSAIILPHIAD